LDAIDEEGWSCDIVSPDDSDWHVADGAAQLAADFGSYISAQNLGVRLSDDTVFHLVRKGDIVDYRPDRAAFGLVEDTDHARLVFVETTTGLAGRSQDPQRSLDYMSVPAYGFPREPIVLDWQIDEDLLLHVRGQSARKAKSAAKTWSYAEMRFSYKLPEQQA
jgi:molecular chaperone DnaK